MDKIKYKFKSIFNFSVICNILPYYGYLHQWMFLLSRISRQTQETWIQNKDAFIKCGGKLRKEKINHALSISKMKKDQFELTNALFSMNKYIPFQIKHKEFDESQNYIIENLTKCLRFLFEILEEDERIIFDFLPSQFKYFRIILCKENIMLNEFPSVLCPSTMSKLKQYSKEDLVDCAKHSVKLIGSRTLVLQKEGDVIKVIYPYHRHICLKKWDVDETRIADFKTKDNDSCSIQDCCCNPTKILIDLRYKSIDEVKKMMLNLPSAKLIKKVIIYDLYCPNDSLNILVFLTEKLLNAKFKICSLHCWEKDNCSKEFTFCKNETTYIFKGKLWTFYRKRVVEWLIYGVLGIIEMESDNFLIIKLSKFEFRNSILCPNIEMPSEIQDTIEHLKNITRESNDIYMIIEKNCLRHNISEFEHLNSICIKFKECQSIEQIEECMSGLPKNLNYEFRLPSNIPILEFNKLLKTLKEFKNSKIFERMISLDIMMISILDTNIQDIFDLKFVCEINFKKHKKVFTYNEIVELLTLQTKLIIL